MAATNSIRLVDLIKNQNTPVVGSANKIDGEINILGKLYNFFVKDIEDKNKSKKEISRIQREISFEQNLNYSDDRKSAILVKDDSSENRGFFSALGLMGIVSVGAGLYVFSDDIQSKIEELKKLFDTNEWESKFNNVKKLFDFSDLIDDVISGKTYGGTEVGYDTDESGAKTSAEQFLGRSISGDEWDQLLRATHAEAGSTSDVREQGMIMGTILNRAREEGGEGSITKVLQKEGQFQAVTGTKVSPGPSSQYRQGPSEQRKQSLLYAAKNVLPAVSSRQTQFTAESAAAYGPGTNIGYREQLKSLPSSSVYGGTRFGTSLRTEDVGLDNSELGTITTSTGKTAKVHKSFVNNFQGFINDLESTGYVINSISGYADRPNANDPSVKSYHSMGAAIDINPDQNPNRSRQTDLPPQTAAIAAKWGLGWGMNWKSVQDPMHFSIATAEQGSVNIQRGGILSGEQTGQPTGFTPVSNSNTVIPPKETLPQRQPPQQVVVNQNEVSILQRKTYRQPDNPFKDVRPQDVIVNALAGY